MLYDAKKHGARVALYGRKINNAEHQLSFIYYLRAIADDQIMPVEAVKAYHADLKRLMITPRLPLEDDLLRMEGSDSYSAKSKLKRPGNSQTATQSGSGNEPDFSKMTPAEKVQWNLERWRKIIG